MFRNSENIILSLSECKEGTIVRIKEISAGKGATINLMNLGLNVNNIVKVSRKSSLHGPVVVTYHDSEIAIGHDLSNKIIVERVSD